ncbi:DUF1223 domain-containing protein [Micavibrio aeruginosavorus]|uniref:DUF1223 domain-containing protein n=1 Tax=Micavibrio aeruginosavorus TaxID=349221 RepID=UPI001F36F882|nr:DUF1223 domain-containing protein [Micavibrio aeruginosavorus]
MPRHINHLLTALICLCFCGVTHTIARAEPVVPAVPAVEVAAEAVPDRMGHGIVFLELFTSEQCPFCPEAERNFRDLLGQDGVMGFTCSVDYFSTGTDPLARPFCTARQDFYMDRIKTGPRYTPQLILNGVSHMSGHKIQDVAVALKGAQQNPATRLNIVAGSTPGQFDIILPAMTRAAEAKPYMLRIALVKKQMDDTKAPHTNQIRQLINGGDWNGSATAWTITPPADPDADAFIVFVQDPDTGRIVAAGTNGLSR